MSGLDRVACETCGDRFASPAPGRRFCSYWCRVTGVARPSVMERAARAAEQRRDRATARRRAEEAEVALGDDVLKAIEIEGGVGDVERIRQHVRVAGVRPRGPRMRRILEMLVRAGRVIRVPPDGYALPGGEAGAPGRFEVLLLEGDGRAMLRSLRERLSRRDGRQWTVDETRAAIRDEMAERGRIVEVSPNLWRLATHKPKKLRLQAPPK